MKLSAAHKHAGENWNIVMYDGMRATNSAAALYFLSIVVIGNYVVLNLFLAILLDKFAGGNEDEENDRPMSLPADSSPVAVNGATGMDDVNQQAAVVLHVHVCAPLGLFSVYMCSMKRQPRPGEIYPQAVALELLQ